MWASSLSHYRRRPILSYLTAAARCRKSQAETRTLRSRSSLPSIANITTPERTDGFARTRISCRTTFQYWHSITIRVGTPTRSVQAPASLLAKSQPCDVDIDRKMDRFVCRRQRFCILHLGKVECNNRVQPCGHVWKA